MAVKTPGTLRKNASNKSTSKPTGTVTPISQGNGAPSSLPEDIQEQIRARAYELYEARGRQEGFHDQDWAQAESEVLSRHHKMKSA